MHLSIVFPAYNEEGNIRAAVSDALAYLEGKAGEVIVVDDGSRDQTGKIIDDLARETPDRVKALHHPKNLGYAVSLRDGFSAARGEWIFYSDSDNQFDLKEIDDLFQLSNGADIVAGYRKDRQDPLTRKFAARVYNMIASRVFRIPVMDIDCAFKLFHRNIFDRIKIESNGFLIDAEILAKAVHLGMTIREVGVTHKPRLSGNSTVRFHHVLETIRGLFWLKRRLRLG